MRIDVLSKEYPPEVYGGAGVHVAELVRALRAQPDVDARVRCFGAPRDEPGTTAYAEPDVARGRQPGDPHPRRRPGDGRRLRRRGPRPLAHLVRQHGRPPRRADARHPARRSAPTRWSRCGRGRPSSSAAATPSRAGWSGRRTKAPPGSSPSAPRCATTCCAAIPSVDPAKVHVIHNGIDTDAVVPGRQPRPGARARRRPRPAERDLRRPDHPAEGAAALPACRGRAAARRPAGAVRRRPRHPRDRGRGARPGRRRWPPPATASSGSRRCSPAPTSSRC